MDYWSITEGVFNCLIDSERTNAFKKAIEKTVRAGDVVVDMGSGSGVLAMIAARCGAGKVYAIEYDAKNLIHLNKVIKDNGLEKIVTVLEGDARNIALPEKVDVIIAEMIATGMIEEQQIPAMNNVLTYAKEGYRVVLSEYESFIDLVWNNNVFQKMKFDIVRYEYPDESRLKSKSITKKISYSKTDLRKINNDLLVDKTLKLVAEKNGVVNGIRISSVSTFSDGSTFGGSFAYSYPIILPIEEVELRKGDIMETRISYNLCGGFEKLVYNTKKVTEQELNQ